MKRRTWEDNAIEFGALSKQGVDVRLAVLVATSVEKGAGGRGNEGVSRSRNPGKTTANAFATRSKNRTTADRILRHLDAWTKCAEEGWCDDPATLTPEDAEDPDLRVPTEDQFRSKFDASQSGGRPRASVNEIASRMVSDTDFAKKVFEALPDKGLDRVIDAANEENLHRKMDDLGGNPSAPPVPDPVPQWRRDLVRACSFLASVLEHAVAVEQEGKVAEGQIIRDAAAESIAQVFADLARQDVTV